MAVAGARIVGVVSLEHHPDKTSDAFAAERPVRLEPETTNRFDRNAIAVRAPTAARWQATESARTPPCASATTDPEAAW
jgi:hypothetical protein